MSKLTKKVASVGLSLTTVVWLSGATLFVPVASAQSVADLQAQIAALLAQIQTLQAQLNSTQVGGATLTTSCSFTRDLTMGSKGDDVKCLQQYLNNAGYAIASSGAGSKGNESTYFGTLTKNALAKWQAANSVSPAVGYFGPISRTKYTAVAGTTTGGTNTGTPVVSVPAGTDLVVSLAADTPSTKTIGTGTAFNPATKVNLTAGSKDVKITSLTITKGGLVANTNLNGVDVTDSSGTRHGSVITSVNSDNSILITMNNDPIVVRAGTTEKIVIRFNLATGNYTGTANFSINAASAIAADTSAISGSFPISGKDMNIVNGGNSLASTTLDVLTTTGSSTLNVSNDLQEITRFRIQETSSNEGAYLYSITLYNYDNASDSDFKDVTLLATDGTVLATGNPVSKSVVLNLTSPYFIDKGLTKDFVVKGKLTSGSNRKVNLVVYNNYDIDLRGASTGVSVIPGSGSNDTGFPIGNGFNIQTIGTGTVTLTKSSTSPTSATVPGAQNVVLAKYNLKPSGENMELRQVSFYIATTTGTGTTSAQSLTGTVFVKVNDSTVYSTGASNVSKTSATTFTLSSYPTLTADKDSVVEVVASVSTNATSNDNYTVKSFDIIQVKRLITNDLLDPGVGAVDGNQIAVKAASLAVTTLPTPVVGSVVVGTTQHLFATVQLNAQAGGEDVKVSQIVLDHVESGNLAEISNLYLYKDNETTPLSTSNSTASNASTVTFSLVNQIVVKRDTPVTLYLKADVVSGSNAHTYRVTSSTSAVTAVGASSGNTLTNGSDITFSGNGQAQTAASGGTLSLALVSGDSASPSSDRIASVGTTNLTMFAFKLSSQYETIKVSSLKVTATTTAANSLATTTIKNIKLREGSASGAVVATAPNFDSCDPSLCSITFQASDNIFTNPIPTTGLTVYVTADIAAGGEAKLGDSFKFKITSSTADITAKGAVSGQSITGANLTGTPSVSGATYVVPQNVKVEAVSPTSPTQVGTSAGITVGIFKITNYGTAPIYLSTSTAITLAQGGSATSTTANGGFYTLYSSAQNGTASDATVTWATSTVGQSGASSTITLSLNSSTVSEANRQIDGGAFRYITLKTNLASANNDTYRISVSALGNAVYYVKESELGYDANRNDSTGTSASDQYTQGLYIDGKPSLDTITSKT